MKEKFITLRIDAEEKKYLTAHAKKNCRTLVDTCRLALREWIYKEKQKAAKK